MPIACLASNVKQLHTHTHLINTVIQTCSTESTPLFAIDNTNSGCDTSL